VSVPGICAALSFVASQYIESAYNWCWRRLNFDHLGMRLKTWTTWR
jgi:hypothetical protein